VQLLDHSDGLFACGHDVLARVDRLSIAAPEKLGGTLGKPQAGIRG
jgi:hypothetical protein